jgi:subtilisin family serine protease/chitodextrinase
MHQNTVLKRTLNRLAPQKPCGLRASAILSIASALLLLISFNASAQNQSFSKRKSEFFKGKRVAAGEVLVKFRSATTTQNIDQAKKNIDADVDKRVGKTGVRLFRSRSKDTTTLVRELSARADVAYVEPNYIISVSGAPNDQSFSQVWGLQNTGQTVGTAVGTSGADISAVSAWEISTGSRQNVVAVVDTGVDYTHPDLAANMWSAPAPFTVNIGGQIIRCEAGTHGFDAIAKTCDPMDEYNHGTHVAGTIGAVGNNGVGITGVNQTASIMALKFMDATGSGTLEDAINAIDFAIQVKQALGAGANVRVLSNSWGWNGEASQALLEEINRANSSEMLFVAAAGNGGDDYVSDNNDASPFYPASYDAPNLITVAATNSNDLLASFSNYSSTRVHLGAPGVLVLSTIMGGSYDWWSGTSMATPHVAGAAALVLSRCSLDTAGIRTNILNNVDPVGSLSGITTTGGRLNVNKAIRACANLSAPPTIELSSPYDGMTYPTYSSVVLQANASDSDGVVSRVDYYVDGKLIDSAQASPYTAHWYATEVGEYTLTGVATDNTGMTTTSRPIKITINETIIPEPEPTPTPNQAPTVSLTSPSNGATYNAPATMTISANASDTDGTVSKVQFYSNNQLIGTATASPYSIAWNNVAAGSYTLQAIVTDNGGIAVGSQVISIKINQPPVASAGGPYNGVAGNALQFNGGGSRDQDGMITLYQWNFGNGNSATGATPSYVYPTAGTYNVTLTITDNNGATNSAKTTAVIAVAPPTAPGNLTAASNRSGEATLRWSDRSTNEQSFKVERSTSASSGFVEVVTLGANQTSYTERGLQRKRTYYYRIRAANSGGNSAYSNTTSVTIK